MPMYIPKRKCRDNQFRNRQSQPYAVDTHKQRKRKNQQGADYNTSKQRNDHGHPVLHDGLQIIGCQYGNAKEQEIQKVQLIQLLLL